MEQIEALDDIISQLETVRDSVNRLGKPVTTSMVANVLVHHKPLTTHSGAWMCECACMATRWEGMAHHLAQVAMEVRNVG
jgi:hypothetical protein